MKSTKKTPRKKKSSLGVKLRTVLLSYVKTQFLLMLVVMIVSWFILSRLGVQFALLLAVVTGAASVVPVFGMLTVGILASLVAAFDATSFLSGMPGVVEGIVVAIIYVCMNAAIDYFLSPYLIGSSTNINPLLLLVLVLVGTSLFGLWGAVLTIPAVLVIKTIHEHQS